MGYEVKDINLAEQGKLQIEWAEKEMGALLEVRKRFEKEKPLKGERIGLLRIRVFRPFPKDAVRRVARKVKRIGVIDRNISFGSEGIFFQEVKSALCNEERKIPVHGFIAGLGGRDMVVESFKEIIRFLKSGDSPKDIRWIGVKK